ncbi:hypothetical protein BDV96DRAFT_651323 [Lophiotrema nucula]|uniref:DUF7730 domain-containing protein n=1 Tax=Lophiotrema nucula TaxID=690887 RepID=A0A6A5YUH0_9PLEO|nr:hypothetical protein BDV96DRAFT_651323 [Lophiotrema nucula]
MPFLSRAFRTLSFQSQSPASQADKPFPDLSGPPSRIHLPLKPGPHPQAIVGNAQVYSKQAPSFLFSKLPVELREMIWEYCMGGHLIHMFWQDRDTLLGFVCDKQNKCPSLWHQENRPHELRWDTVHLMKESELNQEKGFMDLLLTCQAVYIEASNTLYKANTFDFTDHWPNTKYLQWNLPLTALNTLSHIAIACHGVSRHSNHSDFISWKKMWETLALMQGLRTLRVEMVTGTKHTTRESLTEAEDELLEPVMQLDTLCCRGLANFELLLPFPACPEGTIANELRCEIVRT